MRIKVFIMLHITPANVNHFKQFIFTFYMNCSKSLLRLTSSLWPHYLAKFECSSVQLYTQRYLMQMRRKVVYLQHM